MSKKKIKRVFIANRGEIARRIAETAKKLGIETVCVLSGNPPSYLLGLIDQFVQVESETVSLFLDGDRLISFALQEKCDAVHPGFGFLAENSEFSEKVEKAGLTWIGPTADVIRLMADKSGARDAAEKRKVPCLSGLNQYVHSKKSDAKKLETFLKTASYPLLIKAAFGGGGKGMRVAENKEELLKNLEVASRESKSSFGNDTLVIEKYVPESRHVEVQVVADETGQVKILGDRDCSVQRRHQKIIEEAPAPFLSDELRTKLHEASYNLAKGIGYTSCGTVEFLVPWSMEKNTSLDDDFYFLEMNTRLQVEHPVTEEVFGLDIVELQFQIAEGKALSQEIMNKTSSGHSVEARIYMENPEKNFLPSPGEVFGFVPFQQKSIRWEVGIDSADKVSNQFDPMVAKLVATARTRDEAFFLISEALQKSVLAVEASNQSYLWEIFNDDFFLSRCVSTSFLSHHHDRILETQLEREKKEKDSLSEIFEEVLELSSSEESLQKAQFQTEADRITDLAYGAGSFYIKKTQEKASRFQLVRKEHFYNVNGSESLTSCYTYLSQGSFGKSKIFCLLSRICPQGDKKYVFSYNGVNFQKTFSRKAWKGEAGSGLERGNEIRAEVPGKVIKVLIQKQDKLRKNQSCFVLESMKMEFDLKSQSSLVVKDVFVREGDQVESGKVLARLEA